MYSYPLLLGLIIVNYLQKKIIDVNKATPFILGVLFAPLGLLILIKGSFLLLCLAVMLWSALILVVYQRYWEAVCIVVAPLLSLCFFWCVAGQSITTLDSYLLTSIHIASSFTEAMSVDGDYSEVLAYFMASLAVFGLIALKVSPTRLKIYLGGLLFLFLWLSFKAGFVRHFGHALIPATSLLISALLLPYVINSRWTIATLILAVLAFVYIAGHYTIINPLKNMQSTYTAAYYGFVYRMSEPQRLNNNFLLSMNFLRARYDFPLFAGGCDIYSYDQSDLLASGNQWAPRPVFQSYSVFNAYLARLNAHYLLTEKAPATIFFKIQPIDKRLPALEDGMSWFNLLRAYHPAFWIKDFLILEKNKEPTLLKKEITTSSGVLGMPVMLPPHYKPIFAILQLEPTIWGQIKRFIFKPQPLMITLNLSDGSQQQYRFIAAMAHAPFLLSPLIENTNDYFSLSNKKMIFNLKNVKSVTIAPLSPETMFHDWKNSYDIRFISIG